MVSLETFAVSQKLCYSISNNTCNKKDVMKRCNKSVFLYGFCKIALFKISENFMQRLSLPFLF